MCFSWRQHKFAQCSGSMIIRPKLAIVFCIVANRNIAEPQDSGFLFSDDSKDREILFLPWKTLAEVPVQELNQWQLHSFSGLRIRCYSAHLLFFVFFFLILIATTVMYVQRPVNKSLLLRGKGFLGCFFFLIHIHSMQWCLLLFVFFSFWQK